MNTHTCLCACVPRVRFSLGWKFIPFLSSQISENSNMTRGLSPVVLQLTWLEQQVAEITAQEETTRFWPAALGYQPGSARVPANAKEESASKGSPTTKRRACLVSSANWLSSFHLFPNSDSL